MQKIVDLMFLGHFSLGLAAKKVAPQVSLGILFLSVQLLDLLWPVFLLAGVERMEIVNDPSAPVPYRFISYPFSHSLLMAAVWGAVAGGLYWLVRKDRSAALVVGLCVVSHWVLDLLVHVPDLPLYPGDSPLLGLGLWHYKILTLVLECALFALSIFWYLQTTRPNNKTGVYAFWGLMAFLLVIHLSNIFGPPAPSVAAVSWAGHLQWLFVLWAFWVDRNRSAA